MSDETLWQKQRRFSRMVASLIYQAHAMGFEVTLGDAYRDGNHYSLEHEGAK